MLVHGLNLFSLDLLNEAHPSWRVPAGYFMDSNFKVYSTRTAGRPLQMQGSGVHNKTYQFAGSSFRHATLKTAAEMHPKFASETRAAASWTTAATGNPVADAVRRVQSAASESVRRIHAVDLEDGIAKKGIVIARIDGNSLSMSATPMVHLNEDSARDELKRLALQKPGVKFISLTITDSVIAGGVIWQ